MDSQAIKELSIVIRKVTRIVEQEMIKLTSREYSIKKEPKDVHIFIIVYLIRRISVNLSSINHLLTELNVFRECEHSIGLLLRTNLTDFLLILFLIEKKGEDEYAKILYSVLYDSFPFIFSGFKAMKDSGVISEEKMSKNIDSFNEEYNWLAKKIGIGMGERNDLSFMPTSLFKTVAQNPKTKDLSKAYDIYTLYSKYEHFGFFSHEVSQEKGSGEFRRMEVAIWFSITGLSKAFLSIEKKDISDQIKGISELIHYKPTWDSP